MDNVRRVSLVYPEELSDELGRTYKVRNVKEGTHSFMTQETWEKVCERVRELKAALARWEREEEHGAVQGCVGNEKLEKLEARVEELETYLEASTEQVRELEDKNCEELDGTDGAHPAWWRGHEHTTLSFCQLVNRILDGQDEGRGFNCEPWGALRQRLLGLKKAVMSRIKRLRGL